MVLILFFGNKSLNTIIHIKTKIMRWWKNSCDFYEYQMKLLIYNIINKFYGVYNMSINLNDQVSINFQESICKF